MSADALKRRAAADAMSFVKNGMKLGLGTGSTARHFVDFVGEAVADGLDVMCVPTSEATQAQAEALGIPLTTLDETPELDLTVDGADEFDPQLRLIKGGGGAFLREKIVAAASASMVVITDASKEVAILGKFPLPVEVNRFGLGATRALLIRQCADLGVTGPVTLRQRPGGEPFVTDGGHVILDCAFGAIPNPEALAGVLYAIPGVVEHGLFIGLAKTIILADAAGIRRITAQD
jgi:ribose 5-phosphate isomerase A